LKSQISGKAVISRQDEFGDVSGLVQNESDLRIGDRSADERAEELAEDVHRYGELHEPGRVTH